MTPRVFLIALALVSALAACSPEPPSWQKLIASRIADQYPAMRVESLAGGNIKVQRAGLPDVTVEVEPIAVFCRRGPKDCNYAIEQMLLGLRPAPK